MRAAILALGLAACGPTLTPLPPRAPEPVPGPSRVPLSASDQEYFRANPLMVPVEGVRPDRLRDTYNEARTDGRTHLAIDIPAARGTAVLAVTDGSVLRMRQNALGGTTLYAVDRDRRFVYYYAHLDAYADRVTEGRDLRQGDVIGYVGTSGNAPPNLPHLHFQALRVDPSRRDWWNGPPVDVREFLREPGRRAR